MVALAAGLAGFELVLGLELHAVEARQPAGVPQTGDRPAPDSGSWPTAAVAAGTLLVLFGAATVAVAVKRR